ncbi:MAG: peptide chain release factor N(5)-glutamine methyltransferase [Elusimicrobia bacterium]|nr:peptide chain release factor N(5)-glutamine methyltransferase [Elusimicrobiota bacterium]
MKSFAPCKKNSPLELLRQAVRRLREKKISEPQAEAEFLLAEVLKVPRHAWHLNPQKTLTRNQAKLFYRLTGLRRRRIPLGHLTRRAYFMGLELEATPDTFLPRPETEELVSLALKLPQNRAGTLSLDIKILDLGTGSGCIAVALAKFLPRACVDAIDTSPPALAVAKRNGLRHAVSDRIRFFPDGLATQDLTARFDLIVTNPPYLSAADLQEAEPEVLRDPRLALYGGKTGTEVFEGWMDRYALTLKRGGWWLTEMGAFQGPKIRRIFQKHGFQNICIQKDLSGFNRFTYGRY